jgi:DNA-binding LacI/PurR family transcriptional regulator
MVHSTDAPTIYDVARLAGVSQATVSYVISGRRNGKSRISAETRQRVEAAMDELGFFPNETARSLRRQRTNRICLIISRLGSPFADAMAADVERVAAEHGYSLVIAVGGSRDREQRVLDQLHRRLADGVIIESPGVDAAAANRLSRSNVAVVVINNQIEPGAFDVVRSNEREACDQAMDYLLAHGHRRIGFLRHTSQVEEPDPRFEGYRAALAAHGLPCDEQLVRLGAESRRASYAAAVDLLRLPERPTAIFSSSDIGAISAIWAANELGWRVPEDVAVIGAGNTPESAITHPPLTTIGPAVMDFSDIADLLISRLEGRAPPEGRLLLRPWSLIPRSSA